MSAEIQAHYDRVKPLEYTTLVISGGDLYERYYPTFDRPDYFLVKMALTGDEIEFLENNGVSNRDK